MSFLSAFGKAVLTGVQITEEVLGYAPAAERLFPKEAGAIQVVSKDLTQLISIVQDVEVIGQALSLPGDQKLLAAAPLIAQEILKTAAMSGKKIENQELFKAGATKLASGIADMLNACKADINTQDKSS